MERDPETRRFRLGLGLIAVAGPLLAELEERRVAYPVLRELTEQTGETSALMVWNGSESMCVEQIASHHQIKHTTPLGARYQDAMSASVQVFLAAEPAERVRDLLRSGAINYPGMDDASLDGYEIRLSDVAGRGWAINYGESSMDEVGVAAPVYDHRGDIVAVVLIPAPQVPGLPRTAAKPRRSVRRRSHTRSPPGWADVRPRVPFKPAKESGRRQASPASRVAMCNAASLPVLLGSPPHSSKMRSSRWCMD